MGKTAVKGAKAQQLENVFSNLIESCSEPLLCQTVNQSLLLLQFYSFKHELLSQNANIYIDNGSKIQ